MGHIMKKTDGLRRNLDTLTIKEDSEFMANELQTLRSYYEHRDMAPRDWKARGRKVVGYVCNSVPEELIWAAGMMPVRLAGTPGGSVEDITSVFNVNKYTEGFVNTMLNDVMTGKYDYLDYLVLPHNTRNTIQTQYSHLHMIRKLWPGENNVPELYFIEEFQSWSHNHVEYHYETLKEFAAQLTEWSGYELSPRRFREAIEMCNHTRELIGQVQQLRNSQKISGCDALQIMGASYFMDKEEFNRLLEIFLRDADELPVLPGKRIFVEGSPLDNLQLYSLVESCGGIIVNEDNCWGSRSFEDMVDTVRFPDPFEAIAQRYHYKAPCGAIFWPANARCDYCRKKVEEIPSDGVIFYILENDAHGLWDYVDQEPAFQKQGHKTLVLKEQPYLMTNVDELKQEISAFIANL